MLGFHFLHKQLTHKTHFKSDNYGMCSLLSSNLKYFFFHITGKCKFYVYFLY